jgi:outer membrane protein assembly factor BamD
MMKIFYPLLAVFILFSLTACGTSQAEKEKAEAKARLEQPPEQMYQDGQAALKAGEFAKAISIFNDIERQHPYSDFATKAQLDSAKVAYEALRYDDAVMALDRFIELHPGHPQIAEAHYMRALCFYEQIADVKRDQSMTKQALDGFNTVIERFPDSPFAREATLKKDLTLDHIAGQEMQIGRFYQKRGDLNAAINRYFTVIQDYQTTTHVPEALHRLVEVYTKLGLKDEATRIAAVLGFNYPGSKWYEDSFVLLDPSQRAKIRDDRSFARRTIESLLKPD